MTGREAEKNNDIFFVCSLIEHIARKTKNHRSLIVNAVGREKLQHILDLADVYHSDNIDKLSDELINAYKIETGHFDNVSAANYLIPTIWDIGKVYQRLIIDIAVHRSADDFIGLMMEVYNSWISRKIEDLNSSMYYENPDYIFQSFLSGDVLA